MKTAFWLAGATVLALAQPAAAADTIKIGFVSTFSGPTAVIGNDMRNSFELALDHHGRKLGGLPVEVTKDDYGFTWLVSSRMSDELEALVTDLHAVNSSLVDNGFGPQLLCTLVAFRDEQERRLALIYLYKRGSFYPFAPLAGERRDNALELQVKGIIGSDLKWEPDLGRWFPVWGAPGL